MTDASAPADQVFLRRHNLAMVLRDLRDHGPRSRARIAADTGLNKATVSSLVAELGELGLVRDGDVERGGGVGRPGQTVEIDGRICGLGAEVNVDYVAVLVLDLRGEQVSYVRTPLDVPRLGVEKTLDELAAAIAAAVDHAAAQGHDVGGITVGIPGMVETAPGVLRHAPNIGWREVRIADELTARLAGPAAAIRVDNDANLSALAEYAVGSSAGTGDLVYVTGETGVGGGVISDGVLLRGTEGYGGEIGHMPIGDPPTAAAAASSAAGRRRSAWRRCSARWPTRTTRSPTRRSTSRSGWPRSAAARRSATAARCAASRRSAPRSGSARPSWSTSSTRG